MNAHQYKEPDFLKELNGRYLAGLSEQESLFKSLADTARAGRLAAEELADLRHRSHKLAGSGATYGFPDVSRTAAAMENALESEVAASKHMLVFHLDNLIDACIAAHTSSPKAFERPAAAPAEASGPDTKPAQKQSRRPRVLIVDDDPHARDALVGLLLGEAEISTASDAGEAFATMLENRPDLLLLDDRMPGELTGLMLQEKIRRTDSLRSIAVVMITASDASDSVMRALTAGAVDYIVKPFNTDRVGERLRTRLHRLSKSVLIVDDDPAICDLLSRKFASAGYGTKAAEDGLSAFDWIIKEHPNLVVLDKMLPGLDGAMVLQKMRKDAELDDIPVVMLSARRQERDVLSGFDLGAADYVTKPFNPRELVARCVRLLDAQSDAASWKKPWW